MTPTARRALEHRRFAQEAKGIPAGTVSEVEDLARCWEEIRGRTPEENLQRERSEAAGGLVGHFVGSVEFVIDYVDPTECHWPEEAAYGTAVLDWQERPCEQPLPIVTADLAVIDGRHRLWHARKTGVERVKLWRQEAVVSPARVP